MQKDEVKIVGIIRGGENHDYKKSLHLGGQIFSCIQNNLFSKWKAVDILIDKEGVWHFKGLPIKPADLFNKVDLLWNCSDPNYLSFLENFSIPNINYPVFSKVLLNSKEILREQMKKININLPRHILLPVYQEDFDMNTSNSLSAEKKKEKYIINKAQEVLNKFPAPWIVKSFAPNVNMGIHLAKTFPELISAIEDGVKNKTSILVEEFISGKIVSTHALSNYRNQDIYIFPPGKFLAKEKEKLIDNTKNIFKHLEVKHYLRSDFLLSNSGSLYLINLEFNPDFSENSDLEKACLYIGAPKHHIIDSMLDKILN